MNKLVIVGLFAALLLVSSVSAQVYRVNGKSLLVYVVTPESQFALEQRALASARSIDACSEERAELNAVLKHDLPEFTPCGVVRQAHAFAFAGA